MAERILIDGRSGSGKTELGLLLRARIPGSQLVRLDDVYPGWDGLEQGSAAVARFILSARPRWKRWDWVGRRPAEWHELDPARPIIVEGCGALSRASRPLAGVGVWVDLGSEMRQRRALARDGDSYAPHWQQWAEQEERFIGRERPEELADLVVDGTNVAAAIPRLDAVIRGRYPHPSWCNWSSSMP